MQGNSDGLSPSLKPFLGVGHGRALPSAFGFGKCVQGNGDNGYLLVNRNSSPIEIGTSFTVELWLKASSSTVPAYLFNIGDSDNGYMGSYKAPGYFISYALAGSVYVSASHPSPPDDELVHFVLVQDGNRLKTYVNGIFVAVASAVSDQALKMNYLTVCAAVGVHGGQYNSYSDAKIDEFRVYREALSQGDVTLNYNSGIGENPVRTEKLVAWFRFEKFEMLDFSDLQDGSDYRLGVRDHSGRNNHAQPFNLDTDPASPGYALKTF